MEEYTVRAAPKAAGKKLNVFKMHKDDKISWTEAKMRRDNDYQPWQIKMGRGQTARRFKAIKEGGVGENASYFIFYKPKDSKGPYEVCPIDEWYNMSATQRYKTLTAEEAEQKFEQRHKTLNMFSVMHKKSGEAGEEGSSSAGGGGGSRGFKISEMDDWDRSGGESGNSEFDDEDEDAKRKRRRGNKRVKDEPEDAPEEGKEDSDEGDFEQREVDYMSDTSSESAASEGGVKDEADVKGIAEEDALRDLLSTDDETDDEGSPQKGIKPNLNKNSLGTMDIKHDPEGNNSEDSSDSDDYDVDEDKMDSMFSKKSLPHIVKQEFKTDQPDFTSNSNTRLQSSSVPTTQTNKRKAETVTPSGSSSNISSPPKRPCPPEHLASTSPMSSLERTIEDLIRKYLGRKPMPPKALLKDVRSKLKRMGFETSEIDNHTVDIIAAVFKRLNPERKKIGDQVYFSLKD